MGLNVLSRQILAKGITRLDVAAPQLSREVRPGQFVIVTIHPHDDKISLPVVETDPQRGFLTLIFKEDNLAAAQLGQLQINEEIFSLFGPVGLPARIEKWGTVVCLADGMGVTQILPIARRLRQTGRKVFSIIGAPTKSGLILQSQMRLASYRIFMTTEDGSYEKKGWPTDVLKELLNVEKVDCVYAAGSAEFLEGVSALTRGRVAKTFVCLNPFMFDGTGICGSCRVMVNGEIQLACLQGPIFEAGQVDFSEYRLRINATQELLWSSLRSHASLPAEGSTIFKRFLSGTRKE